MVENTTKTPTKKRRISLYDKTVLILSMRPRTVTLQDISDDTGLSVAFLSKLSGSDRPANPSVNHIQKLYEYLSGTELDY